MVRSPAASGPHSPGDLVDSYRRLADEAAPGGLLSAGAFAHFPGAVLLAGHNGIVLNANELAEPIGQLLQSGQHEELRTAVQAALAGNTAQVNPLLVQAVAGGVTVERAFDVAVLPWAGGSVALLPGRGVRPEGRRGGEEGGVQG